MVTACGVKTIQITQPHIVRIGTQPSPTEAATSLRMGKPAVVPKHKDWVPGYSVVHARPVQCVSVNSEEENHWTRAYPHVCRRLFESVVRIDQILDHATR